MRKLESLTIKSRLIFGFGFILALLVLLTVLGTQKVRFIDHTLSEITDENSMKQRYAINFRGSVHDRAIAVRDLFLAKTSYEIEDLARQIAELERFYLDSRLSLQNMMDARVQFSAGERNALEEIEAIRAKTRPLVSRIIQGKRSGEPRDALFVLLEQARPAFVTWLAKINAFIDMQETANQSLTPQARDVAGGFSTLMYVLTTVAVVISILVAWAIEKSLRNSIGGEPIHAAEAVTAIANGELNTSITAANTKSILGQIAGMRDKLTSTVSDIVSASDDLARQTEQVSANSAEILNTARKQGELTTETVEKLDHLKYSIGEINDIARATEENSLQTVASSSKGKVSIAHTSEKIEQIAQTVLATTEQIKNLEDKTNQIGEIVGVIKGISEQTNLLALNAAIEAARAGESGRGFAVVADEVRQLSLRTNDATLQIEKMIIQVQSETSASVKSMETTAPQVNDGLALIRDAMDLLSDIERQAADSLGRVQEVTKASTDQVNTVSDAVGKMQEIASMSGHAIEALGNNNGAVQSLHALSSQLKLNVSYFKVEPGQNLTRL